MNALGFPGDWRHLANCKPSNGHPLDLHFPIGNTGPALLQIAAAKSVCRECPVLAACLAWALDTGQPDGIWGAMTTEERKALKRRNARNRAATKEATA